MASLENSPEIRRLESKFGVELLWLFILSLLKKDGETHAYALRKKIKESFGFLPGNVSAYVVLYKLESRGFVKTKKEGNRVVYAITAKGKDLFREAEKSLRKKFGQLFA